jgi:hypothetical protein
MVGRLAPKKYGGRHGPSDLDGKGVQPAVIVSIGPAASPPTTHDSRSAVVPAIAKSGGLNADAEAENRAEKPSGTPFQITRHRLGDVGKGNGRQFPQGALEADFGPLRSASDDLLNSRQSPFISFHPAGLPSLALHPEDFQGCVRECRAPLLQSA